MCGGSGHWAGRTGRGMERLQPVPATSRVSGNVPRPGLVSTREPCQAVPAGSAAPGSPGGWAGLGGAAGAAGPSGGRAVSPQSSPGRSGRATLGVGVRGAGVASGAQDAERRGGAPGRSRGCSAWSVTRRGWRDLCTVWRAEGGPKAGPALHSPARACRPENPKGGGLTSDPKPGRVAGQGIRG